ncbi:hypothetical protein FB45DRAFT_1063227, partial [Roridomyces roridus]
MAQYSLVLLDDIDDDLAPGGDAQFLHQLTSRAHISLLKHIKVSQPRRHLQAVAEDIRDLVKRISPFKVVISTTLQQFGSAILLNVASRPLSPLSLATESDLHNLRSEVVKIFDRPGNSWCSVADARPYKPHLTLKRDCESKAEFKDAMKHFSSEIESHAGPFRNQLALIIRGITLYQDTHCGVRSVEHFPFGASVDNSFRSYALFIGIELASLVPMPVKKPHPPGVRELAQLLAVDGSSATTNSLIREVSRVLHLPDCNTTRGLRQCHESFAGVSAALDGLYTASRELPDNGTPTKASAMAHDHLAVIVIAIYGRMGEDGVLRQRILSETDFLEKAMSMIDSPTVGARVICYASQQKSLSTKVIACAESRIEETNYAEDAVCVLRHIMTTASDPSDPDSKTLALIPRYLQFALKVVSRPDSGRNSFTHLVMFCYQLSDRRKGFLPNPDAMDFLVACTRANEIYVRVTAQHALIFLGRALEPEISRPCMHMYPAPPQPLPAHIQHALEKFYGDSPWSSFTGTEEEHAQLESLVDAFRTKSRPRADIGQSLARLTLQNEWLIAERGLDLRIKLRCSWRARMLCGRAIGLGRG